MPDIPPDALARFAEVAARYEQAFVAVQERLRAADESRLPAWVFALDEASLDDLSAIDPDLAAAEHERRTWRAALHAMAEHLALGGAAPSADHPAERDDAHLRRLDRFISIVNAAKAGGCIYVDGRFQPVGCR